MKLPDCLLIMQKQEPYVPSIGDIAMMSLQRTVGIDVSSDCYELLPVCDDEYEITQTGARIVNVARNCADKMRRMILGFLGEEGKKPVFSISSHLQKSQPSTSFHLEIMRSEGLLTRTPDGKYMLYDIAVECRSVVQKLFQFFDNLHSIEDSTEESGEYTEKDFSLVLKMLSDPMRIKILSILSAQGEVAVGAMVDAFHESQPAVSHHLALMRDARMISYRRDGKHNRYFIPQSGKHLMVAAGENLQQAILRHPVPITQE